MKSDEDFFQYVLIHCRTELALFAWDHLVRLLTLAGQERQIPTFRRAFMPIDQSSGEWLVAEARARLAEIALCAKYN